MALLSGGGSDEAVQIAIGAIIGAPFVLGTLAMLVIAGSALAFRGRRDQGADVETDVRSTRRDLAVFLALFPVGLLVGALDTSPAVQLAAAGLLLAGYGVYSWRTVRHGGDASEDDELAPLYFDTSKDDPPSTLQIILQFVVSLAAIVGGAELFVGAVESIAESLGVAPLVLALVLAPLATELPEKANSILWVRDGKDTLAVGNVTGAMAFQATIPVALRPRGDAVAARARGDRRRRDRARRRRDRAASCSRAAASASSPRSLGRRCSRASSPFSPSASPAGVGRQCP